jgi:hypothetical protein
MTCVPPNPYSPWATAPQDTRHLLPSLLGRPPVPGRLARTGCGRLTVVPDTEPTDATDLIEEHRFGELPPGICVDCVKAAGDGYPPLALGICAECGCGSVDGDLCARCRQNRHDAWWPTRSEGTAP